MANRAMPSLLALLGLVAVAGYQHRDKIGQMLGSAGGQDPASGQNPAGGQSTFGAQSAPGGPDTLGQAGKVVGQTASDIGASLSNGLNELLSIFKEAGQKEQAESWVTPGVPTQGLSRDQVESAIGRDTLEEVAQKSGLSYDDLVERLSVSIPKAVDRLTPDGNFPRSDEEVQSRIVGA